MEILWKDQKGILDVKTPVTEIKNAFMGLFIKLHTAEERISQLEDILIESSKNKETKS